MKLPRFTKGGMYYVEWDDTLIRNDWADDDTEDLLNDPPTVRFMGWFSKRDKDAVVFILHGDIPPGNVVGERIKVPKGMIRKVIKLEFSE